MATKKTAATKKASTSPADTEKPATLTEAATGGTAKTARVGQSVIYTTKNGTEHIAALAGEVDAAAGRYNLAAFDSDGRNYPVHDVSRSDEAKPNSWRPSFR